MAGFVPGGRSFGAGVVFRVSRSGEVWAFPCCPRGRAAGAVLPVRAVRLGRFGFGLGAFGCRVPWGWRVWMRRARRCASSWEVKLALPFGPSPAGAWCGPPAVSARCVNGASSLPGGRGGAGVWSGAWRWALAQRRLRLY